MKKLVAILAILFPAAALAQNAAVNDSCRLGATLAAVSGMQSTNYLQGIIPSCTVTVYLTGTTTLAPIYSTAGGIVLSNPFTANAIGSTNPGAFVFYAAAGIGLDIQLSGGIPPNTYPAPVTLTDVVPGGGGGSGGGGVTPSTTGQNAYYDSTGLLVVGAPPADAAAFSSVQTAINSGQAIAIPKGTTGTFFQPVPGTATMTCNLDNTSGSVNLIPLDYGSGYTPGTIYSVTVTNTTGGTLTGVQTTAATSAGTITGYTASSNSGFPVNSVSAGQCPNGLTFVVASPPAAQTPVPVINYNKGTLTNYTTVRIDDYGAVGDGVTDDTLAFNAAGAAATQNGTVEGVLSLTTGKTYYLGTVTGSYTAGFDNGVAPIASVFTCTSTGGVPNSPCTLTSAGNYLALATVHNTASSGTGATFTPGAISGQTVSTLTVSGGTGYPASWTVYVGQLCQGAPCTTLAPLSASVGYTGKLWNNLIIEGNNAAIKGGIPQTTGACFHITSWSVTSGVATFQYNSPNCGSVSTGLNLTLEGFATTQTFNGQQITVLSGSTSSSFSAKITGVTGSNTESGAASYYVDGFPYVATLGSGSSGFSNVTIRNLQISRSFIGAGNMGASNTMKNVICTSCVMFVQGQDTQGDNLDFTSTFIARNNVQAGVVWGGMYNGRAIKTGTNISAAGNNFNIFDGTVLNSAQFFYGSGSTSRTNEARQGLDCWFDQRFRLLEAGPIRNSEYCWNPPGGVQRITDDDQASFIPPDDLWRGIFHTQLVAYNLGGRAIVGMVVNNFLSEAGTNYQIIAGYPIQVNGIGNEQVGNCIGANYGTPACPNPFEPQAYGLPSAILVPTPTGGSYTSVYSNGLVSAGNAVSFPWQNTNYADSFNTFPSQILSGINAFLATDPTHGNNYTSVNPINPSGQTFAALIGQDGYVNNPDGTNMQTGSSPIILPYSYYSGGRIAGRWAIQDVSGLYDSTQRNNPLLWFGSTISTNDLVPPAIGARGLRISPTNPQGGNLAYTTITNAGTNYPYNIPVECAIQPSPLGINGSTTSFYIADCLAESTVTGGVTSPTSTRLGVGYTSAPTVIVAPPGAGKASCTATAGVPGATCTVLNIGTGITSCTTTPANFSGTGATYTPTCTNGQVSGLTVSGGTGYPNFWYVFIGTNGGTQATMTAVVTPIDPQTVVEHFEKCAFLLNAGGTVAASSQQVLSGITGNCGNLLYSATQSRTDTIYVGGVPAGLIATAVPTAAGTMKMTLQNITSSPITFGAGPWTVFLFNANADNDLLTPGAVTPTIVTSSLPGGGGSGTVTSFAAPSGSWPSWLVPTVTNSTTTPSLAVAASAIPNAALANASTTVNGQTCTLGSTCTIAGSGTVNSGTSGQFTYYAATGTAVSGNAHLDDGATTASTITSTETIAAPKFQGTGPNPSIQMPDATAPTGVAGSTFLYSDSTTHQPTKIANAGTAAILSGIASAGTANDCVKLAANGIDLVDSGAGCGGGTAGLGLQKVGNVFNNASISYSAPPRAGYQMPPLNGFYYSTLTTSNLSTTSGLSNYTVSYENGAGTVIGTATGVGATTAGTAGTGTISLPQPINAAIPTRLNAHVCIGSNTTSADTNLLKMGFLNAGGTFSSGFYWAGSMTNLTVDIFGSASINALGNTGGIPSFSCGTFFADWIGTGPGGLDAAGNEYVWFGWIADAPTALNASAAPTLNAAYTQVAYAKSSTMTPANIAAITSFYMNDASANTIVTGVYVSQGSLDGPVDGLMPTPGFIAPFILDANTLPYSTSYQSNVWLPPTYGNPQGNPIAEIFHPNATSFNPAASVLYGSVTGGGAPTNVWANLFNAGYIVEGMTEASGTGYNNAINGCSAGTFPACTPTNSNWGGPTGSQYRNWFVGLTRQYLPNANQLFRFGESMGALDALEDEVFHPGGAAIALFSPAANLTSAFTLSGSAPFGTYSNFAANINNGFGTWYKSLAGSNTANTPASSPTFWTQIGSTTQGLTLGYMTNKFANKGAYNSATTYNANDIVEVPYTGSIGALAAFDPNLQTTALSTIPVQVWQETGDSLVPISWAQSFITALTSAGNANATMNTLSDCTAGAGNLCHLTTGVFNPALSSSNWDTVSNLSPALTFFNTYQTPFPSTVGAPQAVQAVPGNINATTVVSKYPTGTGAELVTGPTTAVVGHIPTYVDTSGGTQDSGSYPAFGLTLPVGTPTIVATGTGVTSMGCASSYTCTNTRGRVTLVGGTGTTGTMGTITFSASLTSVPFCSVKEVGGTSYHGFDHNVPTATVLTVTAGVTVVGATLTFEYNCQP